MNWFSRRFSRGRRTALLAWVAALGLLAGAARPVLARPLAQAGGPIYLFQAGDTLYDIAIRFGVTLEALLGANPGVDPAAMQIGQALFIPGFENEPGPLSLHTLEPGETLGSLSLRYGLAAESLIRLNRLINPELLYINEPVVVSEAEVVFTAIPTSTVYAAPNGLLALAAARGQSPWALAATNRLAHPAIIAPGALVAVPGGDYATRALPYPVLELRVGPLPAAQGQTVGVTVVAAEPVALAGMLGEWNLNFSADAPGALVQYALQGIHRFADPDLYPMSIAVSRANGDVVTLAQRVPIRSGYYGEGEQLSVPPETIDPANTAPEDEQIRTAVGPVTPGCLWGGLFIAPSVGVYRSYYGVPRSYNGSPFDFYHSGLDFSGGEDRPITAPAPGVVVFTEFLTVRGRATLIDHGWGVYTGYWHQSSFQVQVGDRVETGQVIGFNGNTGRVTGPHLHWEVWVGGVPVDPLQWLDTAFP